MKYLIEVNPKTNSFRVRSFVDALQTNLATLIQAGDAAKVTLDFVPIAFEDTPEEAAALCALLEFKYRAKQPT